MPCFSILYLVWIIEGAFGHSVPPFVEQEYLTGGEIGSIEDFFPTTGRIALIEYVDDLPGEVPSSSS